MSLKEFQLLMKLGEGAYSSVFKVKRLIDNSQYALKRVKLGNLSERQRQNALNEVRILASIRHPNIIGYKEAFLDESSNSLCIVMEFANNGDLYQKIVEQQKKNQLFPEPEIWSVFIQVVKGLKALHELKILHRDLKSANVFLTKEGIAKLGDMNVSKVAKKGLCETQTGTPYYASPEVWKDQAYDSKSDIWSLGCVIYEMITLKPPFRAQDMEGLYKKVIRGSYGRIPTQYSQDLSNLIRMLLQTDPNLRPSCDKILSMPFVLKHLNENAMMQADEDIPELLRTIKIPKNIHYLTEKLPKPNYIPLKYRRSNMAKSLASSLQRESSDNRNAKIGAEVPTLPFINKSSKNQQEVIPKKRDRDRSDFLKKQQEKISKLVGLEVEGHHYKEGSGVNYVMLPRLRVNNGLGSDKSHELKQIYKRSPLKRNS